MRRSTLEAFRRMFSESGVPGLRVILGFSAPSRRLLWAAVLALLVGLGLHDLYAAFRDFAQYEDTVDVELSRLPEGLVFPAVTICNLNQAGHHNFSMWPSVFPSAQLKICPVHAAGQSVWRTRTALVACQVRRSVFCGDIVLNRSTATEWQQKLCCDRGPRPIWLPEDEASDRKEFFKWVTEMQRRNAATAQLLGHQREDMVLSCRLDDRDCNDPHAKGGLCDGPGLRLLLNVEPEEYLPLSVEAGFVVNVHQAGVQVDFRRDGVFVPPRHTTFVSVDQTILKRLEPPYMNPCQPSWPEEYLQHTRPGRDVYTSRACRDICAQLQVTAACGCQSHDYVILDRSLADICDEDDDNANACIEGVASKICGSDCPCLESCRSPVLAEVVVHLASTQRRLQRHDPKVTVPQLVSSIGSILGMYVGMSFLLVFSVLDMAARAAFIGARRRHTRSLRWKL
ncbi:hypothetical protein IscW_ISCW017829 [Ixodes scapularis]|uniref:Uncharacterized protein n=1 Tax=Ixodes scapularis TaxID=6945 RepID=B7PEV5_IXOSC|nr:hypothetical protein IscW_ISCW017829 [Ixodes scapularis]|eukprot:XP_002433727.1 hypothetical protein IscW_ISCW017829 [Ixodes scapularis]